jgi:hypothetical protein
MGKPKDSWKMHAVDHNHQNLEISQNLNVHRYKQSQKKFESHHNPIKLRGEIHNSEVATSFRI